MKKALRILVVGFVAVFLAGCGNFRPYHFNPSLSSQMVGSFNVKAPEFKGDPFTVCLNVYGGAYTAWDDLIAHRLTCIPDEDGGVFDSRPILIQDLKRVLGGLPVEYGVEEKPCRAERTYTLKYTAGVDKAVLLGIPSPAMEAYGLELSLSEGGGKLYKAYVARYPGKDGLVEFGPGLDKKHRLLAESLAGLALYTRYFLLQDIGAKDDPALVSWIRKKKFSKWFFGKLEGVPYKRFMCPKQVCPGDKFYREYCESKHHKKPASTPSKTAQDGGSGGL